MRRLALVALGLGALTVSMGFLPQLGSVTRRLGDVATLQVPRKARLDAPRLRHEAPTWVSYRLDRSERWDIGEGRYRVNLLAEPTWRLAYHDPARRVSALWQVFQKDWSLDNARPALMKMVESVQRGREPDFAEITERPRRDSEENERKARAALAWLAQRGFAPLEPEQPVSRDGVIVEYMADPEPRLMLYKSLAARPTATLPVWLSAGWRVQGDTGWEYHMSNNDYYPMPGTTQLLDRTQSRPGPHHFVVRTIRLDAMEERDFHLADFFTVSAGLR